MTTHQVAGRIINAPSEEADAKLAAHTGLLREHGLDFAGFHPHPLVVDIAPRALKVVKPLFDIRHTDIGLQFFPCKLEVAGMPFFGYIWVSENANQLRIIGPRLKMLEGGQDVTVEVDSSRALFV